MESRADILSSIKTRNEAGLKGGSGGGGLPGGTPDTAGDPGAPGTPGFREKMAERFEGFKRGSARFGSGLLETATNTAKSKTFWYSTLTAATIAGVRLAAMQMGGAEAGQAYAIAVGAAAGGVKEGISELFLKSKDKKKAASAVLGGAIIGALYAGKSYGDTDEAGWQGVGVEMGQMVAPAALGALSTFIKKGVSEGIRTYASWKTYKDAAISGVMAGAFTGLADWAQGTIDKPEAVGESVDPSSDNSELPGAGDNSEVTKPATLTTVSKPTPGVPVALSPEATARVTLTIPPTAESVVDITSTPTASSTPASTITPTSTSTPTMTPTTQPSPTATFTPTPIAEVALPAVDSDVASEPPGYEQLEVEAQPPAGVPEAQAPGEPDSKQEEPADAAPPSPAVPASSAELSAPEDEIPEAPPPVGVSPIDPNVPQPPDEPEQPAAVPDPAAEQEAARRAADAIKAKEVIEKFADIEPGMVNTDIQSEINDLILKNPNAVDLQSPEGEVLTHLSYTGLSPESMDIVNLKGPDEYYANLGESPEISSLKGLTEGRIGELILRDPDFLGQRNDLISQLLEDPKVDAGVKESLHRIRDGLELPTDNEIFTYGNGAHQLILEKFQEANPDKYKRMFNVSYVVSKINNKSDVFVGPDTFKHDTDILAPKLSVLKKVYQL